MDMDEIKMDANYEWNSSQKTSFDETFQMDLFLVNGYP
jgi:hypothetical protein